MPALDLTERDESSSSYEGRNAELDITEHIRGPEELALDVVHHQRRDYGYDKCLSEEISVSFDEVL